MAMQDWISIGVIILTILVALFFGIIRPMGYPITARIIIERDGMKVTESDKMRVKKKNGIEVWQFMSGKRKKDFIEPVDYKYVMATTKGKPVITLYKVGENTYYPITLDTSMSELKAIPTDALAFVTTVQAEGNDKYKNKNLSTIEKLQPFIPIAMIAICVFAVVFTLEKLGEVTNIVAGQVSNCKAAQAAVNAAPQVQPTFVDNIAGGLGI
jgi:hypothetical protein